MIYAQRPKKRIWHIVRFQNTSLCNVNMAGGVFTKALNETEQPYLCLNCRTLWQQGVNRQLKAQHRL